MAETTKTATVTAGSFAWYTGTGDKRERHEALRNDTVKLPAEELKRGLELGALVAGEKTVHLETGLVEGQEPFTMPTDLSDLKDDTLRDLAVARGVDPDAVKDADRDLLVAMVAAGPGGHERPSV